MIHAIDATTGLERWNLTTGAWISSSCTIAPDGTVLVGGGDGILYAIVSRSRGPAATPWPMFKADPRRLGRLQSPTFAPSVRWGTGPSYNPRIEVNAPPRTPLYLESSTDLVTWTTSHNVTTGPDGIAVLDLAPSLKALFLRASTLPRVQGFVWVEPGTFVMGSPPDEVGRQPNETQHEVTLTQGFWLSDHEVTQEEYQSVMGKNPAAFKGDPNLPVETVSWNEAVQYCQKLTERERTAGRITAQQAYRLPTEAEWEYAARAGTTAPYPGDVDSITWWEGNSGGRVHPVKQKSPNAWGLHDMLGNVWEWCSDRYGVYPTGGVIDPTGSTSGSDRIYRGGSWFHDASLVRLAYRGGIAPGTRGNLLGFRPALSSVR